MISDEDKEKLLEELRKTYLVTNACRKVGISKATYYRWIESDIKFKERVDKARTEGKSLMKDAAESVIISGIQNKDFRSAAYFLSHNHQTYMTKEVYERNQKRKSERSNLGQYLYGVVEALQIWRKENGNKPFPKPPTNPEGPNDSNISLQDQ